VSREVTIQAPGHCPGDTARFLASLGMTGNAVIPNAVRNLGMTGNVVIPNAVRNLGMTVPWVIRGEE